MRAVCARVAILAAAVLAAGCAPSPEEVFKSLKTAALEGDARTIWDSLTPETKTALAEEAAAYYRQIGLGGPGALDVDSRKVYEYFVNLLAGLDDLARQYISSLSAGSVDRQDDRAAMTLRSIRFGAPREPIEFIRVDGRWLWDARAPLELYGKYRRHEFYGGR